MAKVSASTKQVCTQCRELRSVAKGHKVCYSCRELNHRLFKGEVRPPEYTDVTTARYKDPMVKVEKGYGYYGAVTQTTDGKHIQCHICGYYFAALGTHVVKHKIKIHDYKVKYGLRINDGLLSPSEKIVRQDAYNRVVRKTPEEFAAMSRKGREVLTAKGYKSKGGTWPAQTRNEYGNCKDQTLAKLVHIGEINGGVITRKDFVAEYGQGAIGTINYWFGSWADGVKAAGFKTFKDKQGIDRAKRKKAVIKGMRRFYKEHGRTPQTSDFKTASYLPTRDNLTNLWPNLNMARAAAGVPLLVCYGGKWVEVMPDKQEEWMFETYPVAPKLSQQLRLA
jgi:hypothetical protein